MKSLSSIAVAILVGGLLLSLSGCSDIFCSNCDRVESARNFPRADRPIAAIVDKSWSADEARARLREAEAVLDEAQVAAGMTVADIGAGAGFYTIRLAERVGTEGRVLAQDIQPAVISNLADSVARERLDHVALRLGKVDDPRLPADSFDRVFLVRMYHQVGEPYAFLWRLYPSLTAQGEVVVVDSHRPIAEHGMPIALLLCEFEAVGFQLVAFAENRVEDYYIARFRRTVHRPAPTAIIPCKHR